MNNLPFFQLKVPGEESLISTTLMEHFKVSSIGTKPLFGNKINGLLLLILICSIVAKKVSGMSASPIWKVARKKRSHSNPYQQIPCRNCKFFSNNPSLKCAVRPTTVLTEQALNCSDYLFQHIESSVSASVVTATVFDPQTQSWYNLRNLFENSESVWAVVPFLSPHATPAYTLFQSKVKGDR